MEKKSADWYKNGWSLDIQNMSWTEETVAQVDFLISALGLKGGERILDLACGFGRHSLELARRGYDVVGVDITPAYIEYATKQAEGERLSARFICADIRDVDFCSEFDVVLNMADGAVGYLENEQENLRIFDVVARALKVGGRHFMDIMSADYADTHFPCRLWDMGEKGLTLSVFEWDRESCILIYGQNDFTYGEVLTKPVFEKGDPIRLYHLSEVTDIMSQRQMQVQSAYADFGGAEYDENSIQLRVISQRM